MDRYEDFWHITADALRSAVRQLSIGATDRQLESLMQAYLVPPAFPEVVSALEAVKGLPLAVLSNGSPAMLDSAVRYNSMESYFAEIISVESVKTYKPSARVYELGSKTLNLLLRRFFSFLPNFWDVAGAKAFGYPVCWCNRSGAAMEEWGFAPDFAVSRLDQIGETLKGRPHLSSPATIDHGFTGQSRTNQSWTYPPSPHFLSTRHVPQGGNRARSFHPHRCGRDHLGRDRAALPWH